MDNYSMMLRKVFSGVEYWPIPRGSWEPDFLKLGFSFFEVGDMRDSWFVYVTLPNGWKMDCKNEYLSELVDAKGNRRGAVIIAMNNGAVTYASAYIRPRYILGWCMEAVDPKEDGRFLCVSMTDLKTDKKVTVYKSNYPLTSDILEILNSTLSDCEEELDKNFPIWRDPRCWDDNGENEKIKDISEMFNSLT